MLVDTHGHINFKEFKDDSEDAMRRALEGGVGILMPGAQLSTSRRAVEFAEQWDDPRVWAAVGLHPIHLNYALEGEEPRTMRKDARPEELNRAAYEKLLASPKCVAVGEFGLDYWDRPKGTARKQHFKQKQKETLIAQLDMAADAGKPAILHCRVAHDDLLAVLRDHRISKQERPGVIHSYTGDKKQLKAFLDMGYYVGVNGIVFKLNWLADIIKEMPLERMLLETDAPYLTPPKAPTKRNEPLCVKYIAEEVAKIKGVDAGEIEKHTTQNAADLFGVSFA